MKKGKMDSLKLIKGGNGNSDQVLALHDPDSGSLSGRCLRSRTVKMRVENETGVQKSASKKKSDEISRNGRCLRFGGEDYDLIELSANKCLSFKPVKKQIGKEKEKLEISDSMESAYDVLLEQKCFMTPDSNEVSEVKRELEKCDFRTMSEKCLREFLVPDSVLAFEEGKSKRPFARVWWDETVSTVVTFLNVHALAILHSEQDRVLTIRECARLHGLPDFYRFSGTVKERYRQIGNAVSIPVSRALGYALGMAYQKVIGDEPLMTLPPNFSSQLT